MPGAGPDPPAPPAEGPGPTYDGRGGLRVWMRREPGFTDPHVLTDDFLFHVPPLDEFRRSHSFAHTDYDAIRRGQFSRPQGRQLSTVQFQAMFLDYDYYWTLGHDAPDPIEASRQVVRACEAGTPFRLMAGMPVFWGDWEVDMLATLRQVDVAERAGEIDARYADVQFVEYRDLEVPRRKRRYDFPLHRAITRGDTLGQLSKRYYGEWRHWRVIHRANRMGDAVGPRDDLHNWEQRSGKHKVVIPEPPRGVHPPRPG